ncbi:Ppx/GppA family phosphatase [Rhodobacteraceae bacterium]|nr:Ppx/GppA family phosphatase [Paracoccaceae bacterium]
MVSNYAPSKQEQANFDSRLRKKGDLVAVSKVGVVDIGSNSVRLVVFDGAARSPAYYYNEKIMCALGAGLAETGCLNPEGRTRAVAAILRFTYLAKAMGIPRLIAVATAAVRDAQDGAAFVQELKEKTGQAVLVIKGKEEARLSAQGVLLGWPGAYGLICDLGGSSMELAEIGDGIVGKRISARIGPLKLRELQGGAAARQKLIARNMAKLTEKMGPQHNRLFLVGGSWRALARIDMERRAYPLHVIHEYRMDKDAVQKTAAFLRQSHPEKLRIKCGISRARMVLLPYAIEVLDALVESFTPIDIALSSYGIREGLLYEQMSKKLRKKDPLIEACAFAEMKDARAPGFGLQLFKFVLPLFPTADDEATRLIKAACHLHDVSWRGHPDYRAEICFDNATRANLGGLKHAERVFLGLSLMHRYRNQRKGHKFENLFSLLSQEQIRMAEILGKAMRLGAMMWVNKEETNAKLFWTPDAKALQLVLEGDAVSLYGEVAEARLKSLARAMNASFAFQAK